MDETVFLQSKMDTSLKVPVPWQLASRGALGLLESCSLCKLLGCITLNMMMRATLQHEVDKCSDYEFGCLEILLVPPIAPEPQGECILVDIIRLSRLQPFFSPEKKLVSLRLATKLSPTECGEPCSCKSFSCSFCSSTKMTREC